MKRLLMIVLLLAGWLIVVLLVGGLMGWGARSLGINADAYRWLLLATLVVLILWWLRNRWRRSVRHYREHVAPENELAALEEMASDYARGRYDNREYIEEVVRSVKKDNEPSASLEMRLAAVHNALAEGDLRRLEEDLRKD